METQKFICFAQTRVIKAMKVWFPVGFSLALDQLSDNLRSICFQVFKLSMSPLSFHLRHLHAPPEKMPRCLLSDSAR